MSTPVVLASHRNVRAERNKWMSPWSWSHLQIGTEQIRSSDKSRRGRNLGVEGCWVNRVILSEQSQLKFWEMTCVPTEVTYFNSQASNDTKSISVFDVRVNISINQRTIGTVKYKLQFVTTWTVFNFSRKFYDAVTCAPLTPVKERSAVWPRRIR